MLKILNLLGVIVKLNPVVEAEARQGDFISSLNV
jgi:hypothetical protein